MWSKINGHRRRLENEKKDPIKLEKRRKTHYKSHKKWCKRNKERMNSYCREMRKVARDLGNCTSCFKERDNPKYKLCSKCRAYFRIKSEEHRNKQRKKLK